MYSEKHRSEGISVAPKKVFKTIDEYIATFPREVQHVLEEMRQTIRDSAPEAEETISYNMPAFKQNGILVWFAAFKNHIGFYPKVSALEAFKEKLTAYKVSKGTVRFPLNKPIPYDFVKEIVRFRVKENLENQKFSPLEHAHFRKQGKNGLRERG
jgi:uncharacterized protein YdhG (YjbR/CyaY superfamily)